MPPRKCAAHHNYASRISRAFVDCLVELHAIDVEKHGLTSLGKPEGFVERQVKGWSERWERARTEANPEMDRVMAWLAATIPASGTPTLVHNDFKLDNVMLDEASPDRIEAVLDWEMTTIGDPSVRLGLDAVLLELDGGAGDRSRGADGRSRLVHARRIRRALRREDGSRSVALCPGTRCSECSSWP